MEKITGRAGRLGRIQGCLHHMDRELLLEIGCEELPAGWLPGLTNQVGEIVDAQLRAHRLPPESPVETYSTPRRLTRSSRGRAARVIAAGPGPTRARRKRRQRRS